MRSLHPLRSKCQEGNAHNADKSDELFFCLFVFFPLLFFFFTQGVLSVVNIYYDLPKSCDFLIIFLYLFSCVRLNMTEAFVSLRGLLTVP